LVQKQKEGFAEGGLDDAETTWVGFFFVGFSRGLFEWFVRRFLAGARTSSPVCGPIFERHDFFVLANTAKNL
jgi:hypothetical protein